MKKAPHVQEPHSSPLFDRVDELRYVPKDLGRSREGGHWLHSSKGQDLSKRLTGNIAVSSCCLRPEYVRTTPTARKLPPLVTRRNQFIPKTSLVEMRGVEPRSA